MSATQPLSEQHAILAGCVHPTGHYRPFHREEIEQSVPSRFEAMVESHPARLAIKDCEEALTYDALNRLANRIAYTIVEQMDDAERIVALVPAPDTVTLAAILGVLKAGKAYTILHPADAKQRNMRILQISRAGLVLTSQRYAQMTQGWVGTSPQVLTLDTVSPNGCDRNLGLPITPNQPAYVLFTSGSTGEPKGVMQTHRNLLHVVMDYTNDIHICPDDRLSQASPVHVAASVRNIFSALLNGAALFPYHVREQGVDPLASWLAHEGITVHHANPPSIFRRTAALLIAAGKRPDVRLIRLAGDAIYPQDIALYKQAFADHCVLLVAYATSETDTIARYAINKSFEPQGPRIPVGYPGLDKQMHLIDEAGQTVGFDQVGEITVTSPFLNGYWQRPDLTRDAFRPAPIGEGHRTYRTGDLGVMRPDGALEHMGRVDFQVKIRGLWVDTVAVEAALLHIADITEAMVMSYTDASSNQRLVAYVVTDSGHAPAVNIVRQMLSEHMPSHMVPSVYVTLAALPRTPSGKVDRSALPAPSSERPTFSHERIAPRTPLESELAQLWCDVLGLEAVGVHDLFLDLGGDSLLATRLVTRVGQQYRTAVSLDSLLQSATVAKMAIAVIQSQAEQAEPEDLDRLLSEVEGLSEEDAQQRLVDDVP